MKKTTKPSKAFKKIKTFEDACKIMNVDPKKLDRTRPKALRPHKKLKIIMDAMNKGTKLECLYVPYFKYNKNKFSFANEVLQSERGTIFFATQEMAKYAGRQFEGYFNETLNK